MSVLLTSHSYSDSFMSKRAEAIKEYNNGKVDLAFKKLKSLVKKGDSEAARDMGILLIRGKFSKDWTARIMGIAVVGGFMGYIFLVTLQPPEQNSEALINLVLGYLGGLARAVISFYFGASNTKEK